MVRCSAAVAPAGAGALAAAADADAEADAAVADCVAAFSPAVCPSAVRFTVA
jgi:hypothetical protein